MLFVCVILLVLYGRLCYYGYLVGVVYCTLVWLGCVLLLVLGFWLCCGLILVFVWCAVLVLFDDDVVGAFEYYLN